jgi:hypothetical protein
MYLSIPLTRIIHEVHQEYGNTQQSRDRKGAGRQAQIRQNDKGRRARSLTVAALLATASESAHWIHE